MYAEQLNLNEQATNLQLGIMEALTDPLLNRDMEHTIESIFDVTSKNSLVLDHTSDIIPDIPEQSPISLAQSENSLLLDHTSDFIPDISEQSPISLTQAHLLSEFEFTIERGARCLLENGFSYKKTFSNTESEEIFCNARIHTRNQIVVNRI